MGHEASLHDVVHIGTAASYGGVEQPVSFGIGSLHVNRKAGALGNAVGLLHSLGIELGGIVVHLDIFV